MQTLDLVGHVPAEPGRKARENLSRPDAHTVAFRLFSQFVPVGIIVAAMDGLNRIAVHGALKP